MTTYEEVMEAAEKTGIPKEGVQALLSYYTEQLDWGMNKAVNYVKELFDNGTMQKIKEIQQKEKPLFKGKSIKTGEWVYGYYVHYNDVKDNGKDDCDYIVKPHDGECFKFVEVVPETISQCKKN